jgi:hypothetical protein
MYNVAPQKLNEVIMDIIHKMQTKIFNSTGGFESCADILTSGRTPP